MKTCFLAVLSCIFKLGLYSLCSIELIFKRLFFFPLWLLICELILSCIQPTNNEKCGGEIYKYKNSLGQPCTYLSDVFNNNATLLSKLSIIDPSDWCV